MKRKQEVSPERIRSMTFGFAPLITVWAGIETGLINSLSEGPMDTEALSEALGADSRGTRILADALVGLELLGRKDGRYSLTEISRRYLATDDPKFDMKGIICHGRELIERWFTLPEAVMTGLPVRRSGMNEERFKYLARALFPGSYHHALSAREAITARNIRPKRILDLACGSGAWSLPFAEGDPEAEVWAADYPSVLTVAHELAVRYKTAERLHLLPGDIMETKLPEGNFDLVILGHICHSLGEEASRALLARVARALAPGGHILIADMVADDERLGIPSPFPLLFGVNMLVATEKGDVFTKKDYESWLDPAGLGNIEYLEIAGASPLILARRPQGA